MDSAKGPPSKVVPHSIQAPHSPALPVNQASTSAPLYIRWGPDRSPYSLEFRFDLVGRVRDWLTRTEQMGVEVGGVLIGSLPNPYSSTIRVEEIEFIERDVGDGLTFMLNPGQHDRFAEIRWRTRDAKQVALGLFRSHLRPGAMRPSLADRTLLSNEFSGPVYILMLVGGTDVAPRANFFIAAHGQLPVDPSIVDFDFDERALGALPEVDVPVPVPALSAQPAAPSRRWGAPAAIAGGILAAGVVVIAMLRGVLPVEALLGWISPSGRAIHLQVSERGSNKRDDQLRISWDRSSLDIQLASSGLLRIRAQDAEQVLILGADDLRLGTVVVGERVGGTEVMLSLQAANRTIASEKLVVP